MNGYQYRTDATAILDPDARERLIGGSELQLITLQLHDTGCYVDELREAPRHTPAVRCELRADEARALAARLLACANQAERHGPGNR